MSQVKASPPVEQMLGAMDTWGASDLFLCADRVPSVRLHGQVVPLEVAATPAHEVERFLAAALPESKLAQLRQSGDVDASYGLSDGRRFRLNVARQLGRLGITARALPKGALSFERLAIPLQLRSWAERSRGLILVAGNSGAGKSTTVAAMLHHINQSRAAHIVTIEDPVEFLHADARARVTQREVGTDTESVEVALRQALRESPDVLVVGHLRSREAAELSLQAALAGQLVLASINTRDVVQALGRVVNLFPEQLGNQVACDLASALVGVAAQRLIPRAGGRGRALLMERLQVTPQSARLIRVRRSVDLEDMLRKEGDEHVCSFDRALLNLQQTQQIDLETALAHASHPEELSLSSRRVASRQSMPANDATADSETSGELSVEYLLARVQELQASDLHLSVGRPPTLRVFGRLRPEPSAALRSADVRLLLHSIMSVRQRALYEQEREIDFSLSVAGGRRFRVNAYYERDQMAAAFRAIPSRIPDADELGLPPALLKMGAQPHGLLLVVGPTGAGKTTTLACLIDRINRARACHVITVEDPIEYVHPSQKAMIHQREVGPDTKGFAVALRHILRQDPDVILIGELRDLETVSAALTAAETGHLVLATLHTNDAIQTIDRIIDVFPPHQQPQVRSQLSAALIGVVSQRLLPRADGLGRCAAFEVMLANSAIRTLIRENKMHQALGLMQAGRGAGMITMDGSIEELITRGLVDKNEAMRYMLSPASADRPRARVG